jgi:uncharacterized protein
VKILKDKYLSIMIAEHILYVSPEEASNNEHLENKLSEEIGLALGSFEFRKTKQSIDARKTDIVVRIVCDIYKKGTKPAAINYSIASLPSVEKNTNTALIVGAGPAGMFAALRCIELGIKPIVFERGKNVQDRRRDLAAINKDHIVNPESNYCFGEGGAGTYSDGKLYTRSKKRGDILRILEILVAHGAPEDILYEAHPHIGTNKLPKVVAAMRETILDKGGQIHFNAKVTDFIIEKNKIKGVIVNNATSYLGEATIVATGHSARDIFELCHARNIFIEAKPFAMGVRIEHHQTLIDKAQYKVNPRGQYLPAASYALVTQTKFNNLQKGVFSFCMCPGGFIVPAATAQGELVVNGMSPSRRDSKYANSGMVVQVDQTDWAEFSDHGPLAALRLQQKHETLACQIAGNTQVAPAQLAGDFIRKKVSKNLLPTSYQPGLSSINFMEFLPKNVGKALQLGLSDFNKKITNYATNMGQLIGLESRTSSPVRIPRDPQSLEHPYLQAFYPCGEGAGYAGGIVSAAMDGERCAEMIKKKHF